MESLDGLLLFVDFIEKYSNVNKFNIESLEKFNDISTINFHLQTNKRPDEYMLQLITKLNRDDLHKFPLPQNLLEN